MKKSAVESTARSSPTSTAAASSPSSSPTSTSRLGLAGQPADDVLEFAGRNLAGAASAVGIAGEPDGSAGSFHHASDRVHRSQLGAMGSVSMRMEASGFLVVPPVFKTGEIEYLGLAGSIPVRLRQPLVDVTREEGRGPGRPAPVRFRAPTSCWRCQRFALPRAGSANDVIRAIVRDAQERARRGDLAPAEVEAAVLAAVAPRSATTLCARCSTPPASSCTPTSGRAPLSGAARRGAGARRVVMSTSNSTWPPAARSRRGAAARAALLDACPGRRGRAGGQQRRRRTGAGHHRAGRRPARWSSAAANWSRSAPASGCPT